MITTNETTATQLLVLRCHSSNEDYDGGCRYAALHLAPGLAVTLLAAIHRLNQLRTDYGPGNGPGLWLEKMYYSDSISDIVYFDPSTNFGETRTTFSREDYDAQRDALEEAIYVAETPDGIFLLPAGFAIHEEFIKRTEMEKVIVRWDGIIFFTWRGNAQITTEELTTEVLEQVARGNALTTIFPAAQPALESEARR